MQDPHLSPPSATPNSAAHRPGCLVCGAAVAYVPFEVQRRCEICGQAAFSSACCEKGHFVCDDCHSAGLPLFAAHLRASTYLDPIRMFLDVAALSSVHMHGPEHHTIVACVLLAAWRNNGGPLPKEDAAFGEAVRRGSHIPGGACGAWGVCGAAVGTGIFASIVTGSNPLNAETWPLTQRLVSRCLARLAEVGGPRCCKRASRLCIETAAEFSAQTLGVSMPVFQPPCTFHTQNIECIGERCPFFAKS